MKKATALIAALATILIALPALADQSTSCSWENGEDILGFYGNVGSYGNASLPDPVHTGSHSLTATESPFGGTPQVYVAYIEGLTDGDQVTACFWGYDTTVDASPSLRIWGHYALSGDVNSSAGSAGGNATYTDGLGWSQVCNTWTFDSSGGTRDALVVEARLYSIADGDTYFIDDVEVSTTSATATLSTPCSPPVSVDPSSWGQVKAQYR